jgi:m7GpppX diphosphatase
MKVSTIYPASEKHIMKFRVQECFLVQETPEMYNSITLPHISKDQFTLDWVYNILDHKKETERIIVEDLDPKIGFVLLPDFKWNEQIETLYLLAIVVDRNIKSIRDLNASHLSLLENVRTKSLQAIKEKFNVDASQIRAYFHYQPSFYHLHIHFTILKYDAPGIFCEKSHLLDTVINNIKLMPDYYEKATLTFAVRKLDKLYQAIKNAPLE